MTTIRLFRSGAIVLALMLPGLASAQAAAGSPAAAVNVFIGAGGDGHTFPGASRPFGKTFTIRAVGLNGDNNYVASVTLNGAPLSHTFLRHEQIMAGGELVFTMAATPNREWGQQKSARPYIQTAY